MEYDAGDEKKVRKRKTKADIERERQVEELKKLLEDKGSRYFLWRLLEYCQVFHTTSYHDPTALAINSGKRDPGIWVIAEIFEANPNAYTLMRQEAQEREKYVRK